MHARISVTVHLLALAAVGLGLLGSVGCRAGGLLGLAGCRAVDRGSESGEIGRLTVLLVPPEGYRVADWSLVLREPGEGATRVEASMARSQAYDARDAASRARTVQWDAEANRLHLAAVTAGTYDLRLLVRTIPVEVPGSADAGRAAPPEVVFTIEQPVATTAGAPAYEFRLGEAAVESPGDPDDPLPAPDPGASGGEQAGAAVPEGGPDSGMPRAAPGTDPATPGRLDPNAGGPEDGPDES